MGLGDKMRFYGKKMYKGSWAYSDKQGWKPLVSTDDLRGPVLARWEGRGRECGAEERRCGRRRRWVSEGERSNS